MSRKYTKVLKETDEFSHTECDVCHKQSKAPTPEGWLNFSTETEDWGECSVDFYDVCSPACFKEFVLKVTDAHTICEMELSFAKELCK